jgi:hypothetical protein
MEDGFMGWEARPSGRFYYRSRRVGGRVLKTYLGNGPAARLAALMDGEAEGLRRAEAAAIAAERARVGPAEEAIARLEAACELVLEATLTAAGYHRVDHGPWRRRNVPARTHVRPDRGRAG